MPIQYIETLGGFTKGFSDGFDTGSIKIIDTGKNPIVAGTIMRAAALALSGSPEFSVDPNTGDYILNYVN